MREKFNSSLSKNPSLRFHARNVGRSIYLTSHIGEYRFQHAKDSNRFSPDERERVTMKWKSETHSAQRYGDASFDDKERRRIRGGIDAAHEIYLREKSSTFHRVHASRDLLSGQRGGRGEKDFVVFGREKCWSENGIDAPMPRRWRREPLRGAGERGRGGQRGQFWTPKRFLRRERHGGSRPLSLRAAGRLRFLVRQPHPRWNSSHFGPLLR